MIIIGSANENGIVYVETAELDGESNLKMRKSAAIFDPIRESLDCEKLAEFCDDVLVECDLPNNKLHEFVGNVKSGKEEKAKFVTNENVSGRGYMRFF